MSEKLTASFRAFARFVSIDPARNRFRYYSLSWQPTLWGGGAVMRTWGRIGTRGRTLETFYDDRTSAQKLIDQLVRRRLQHGYSVVDAR